MVTTITKKIGATNSPTTMDYSTLALWFADCPADLTSNTPNVGGSIWDGQCYDQGKFTAGLTLSGITTDATRYIVLECASGASFSTKSGVRTTALNYNSTTGNGVAYEVSSGFGILCEVNYCVFDGLQGKSTTYAIAFDVGATNVTVKNCIFTSTGAFGYIIRDVAGTIFENCLIIYTFAANNTTGAIFSHGSYYNCTLVCTAASCTASGFVPEYVHQALVQNCAVFGFGSFTNGTLSTSSDYNATDLGTASGGAHDQTSLTFSAQFTNSTNDWRAAFQSSGTGLHNGTPDSTHSATDISHFTRDVVTPYIGAWDASAPSATLSIAEQDLPSSHNGNITVHAVGVGTSFVNGTTTMTASGVTGWSVSSTTVVDSTHATVVLTPPGTGTYPNSNVGTLTLTEGVTGTASGTTHVFLPTISVSPVQGNVSSSVSVTFTGAHTLWATDTPSISISGPSGTGVGSFGTYSNTSVTATITTGSTAGSGTITDPSTGATTAFVVGGTITVSSPMQWQTYQRVAGVADIPISGTWTGGPTGSQPIEAIFNGGTPATIATVTAGSGTSGSFSGTLSAQAQGQGTLTVRFKNSTAVSTTVSTVGIGDVFLVAGQSNSVGPITNLQTYTNGSGLKAAAYDGANWVEGKDYIFQSGIRIGGSAWPLLATHHMNDQSVPCCFVAGAVGGRSLAVDDNTHWFFTKYRPDTGAQGGAAVGFGPGYTHITTNVANSGVNSILAAFWYQGENDADANVTQDVYQAALIQLADNLATDLSGAPKTFCVVPGGDSSNVFYRPLALAISGAVQVGANLRGLVSVYDFSNELHLVSGPPTAPPTDVGNVANRMWACLKSEVFGGTSGGGHGPRVVSCQYNASQTAVTVCFDKVLKTGLTFSHTAWSVSGNGSGVVISDVQYHATNTRAIVISLASVASLPILVSFADMDTPAGLTVPLGPDFVLPAGAGTINLPAEPFKNVTAAAAEVSGGGGGGGAVLSRAFLGMGGGA